MKKIISLLLAVIMLVGSLSVMADGTAIEIEDISVDVRSASGVFTSSTSPAGIYFQDTDITYNFDVETAGVYLVKVNGATRRNSLTTSITFTANGIEQGTTEYTSTSSGGAIWKPAQEIEIGTAYFASGSNEMTIAVTNPLLITSITLVFQAAGGDAAERDTIYIGDIEYEENGVYNRGTDTITVEYTDYLMNGVYSDVTLTSGDKSVSLEAKAADASLVIALTEALDYNTEYTLTLSGVTDMYNNLLDEEVFTFSTGDETEDAGESSAEITAISAADDFVTVKGMVYGSHGLGMLGRQVELYITAPGYEKQLLTSGVTEAFGEFYLMASIEEFDIMNADIVAEVAAEYADETVTALVEGYTSSANVITILPRDYSATTNKESTANSGNGIYYGSGMTITYTFDVKKENVYVYNLSHATAKGNPTELTFEFDGVVVRKMSYDPTGTGTNFSPSEAMDICAVKLTEGQHTLKVTNNGAGHMMSAMKFTALKEATVFDSAKIGQALHQDINVYPESTDYATLCFTGPIDLGSLGGVVVTDSEGRKLDFEASVDNLDISKINIAFKEALGYGNTYIIEAPGIKDQLGNDIIVDTITFVTADQADSADKPATLSFDTFTVANGVAKIGGKLTGTIGQGIKGRIITWYLSIPGESPKTIEITTGADGIFAGSYTIAGDNVAGTVSASLIAQYGENSQNGRAEKSLYYISDSKFDSIVNVELAGATDAQGVEAVLTANEAALNIDLENDLTGLDREGFYELLAGENAEGIESIEEFRTTYKLLIGVEKINQAQTRDDIIAILGDADTVAALGMEEMLTVLSYPPASGNLTNAQQTFVKALNDAERTTTIAAFNDMLKNAFSDAINEEKKYTDITLSMPNKTITTGQDAAVELAMSKPMKNIAAAEFTVVISGVAAGNYNNLAFTSSLGDTECIPDANDKNTILCKITLTPESVLKETTSLGTLSFTTEKTGVTTVSVEGVAEIALTESKELRTYLDIIPTAQTITVKNQVTQDIGGGSSTGIGGGKGSGSGGGGAITPVPVPNAGNQTQGRTYVDLDSVPWAQEYILGMLSLQAITLPEDGKFNPTRNVTRAEFIKMIVLANAMWVGTNSDLPFADTKRGDWYYQYLQSAYNNKLITGDASGAFRPNDTITREDICVILARLKKAKNANMNEIFADDYEISDYAKTAVYYMKEAGIVNGVGDNRFAPKAFATRAEAAKIIYGTVKQ